MNQLLNLDNFSKYIIPLGTFVLGFIAEKIMDKALDIFNKKRMKMRTKKAIEKLNSKDDDLPILVTATGFPNFSDVGDNNKKLISVEFSKKENFLSLPKGYYSNEVYSVDDFYPEDKIEIEISAEEISKEQIVMFLEESRKEVAESFLNRTDGAYFNGKSYGVLTSDAFARTSSQDERPVLNISLYKTDYYTHRVFERTMEKLAINKNELSLSDLNNKYPAFRTSLGVSVIVVIPSSNEIILTVRNKTAAYNQGKNWIYVSVTEAFSETDFDTYTGKPDINLCIQRGLTEELGITGEMYDPNDITIYDMFFEKEFFQDGITASVKLRDDITLDQIKKKTDLEVKDKGLEIDDMYAICNKKEKIEDYIEKKKESMRAQTIFALRSYMSRL